MRKKLITGAGILGLGIVLLSFIHGNGPKMKKYEVIRSVNGEVSTYDTLVAQNSTFTPEQYLEQLGFSNDLHIEIIRVPSMHEHMMMMHHSGSGHGFDTSMMMQFHGNPHEMDSMMVIEMEILHDYIQSPGEGHHPGHMTIEKSIVIKHTDSLDQQHIMDHSGEMAELHKMIEVMILDSTIPCPMQLHTDSNMFIMHTVVINEAGDSMNHHSRDWTPVDGEPTFERYTQHGNQQSDFMIFGVEKDFTIVIVTDDETEHSQKSHVKTEIVSTPENVFKLYPNPANKEVSVQLSFDEKATTIITVSDTKGNVVMQLDLGEFSGNYIQSIDVSKWSKGVYFVNVDHGGTKLVEKLVVE